MDFYNCAIAGVTGSVGQKLTTYLDRHPYLQLTGIFASEKSAGKSLRVAIKGSKFFRKMDCSKPSADKLEMRVENLKELNPRRYDIIFSVLDSDVADLYEKNFSNVTNVFTSAAANRYAEGVPIHNISVNDDHLKLIYVQKNQFGKKGFICSKSNCTTSPIVSILSKIIPEYGVDYVRVYTEQALSGAGKKGLDENSPYRKMVKKLGRYPYIEGEEDKVKRESREILGSLIKRNGEIIREPAEFKIDAYCTRVARENVHYEEILVITKKDFDIEEMKKTLLKPIAYSLRNFPRDSMARWEDKVIPKKHVERFGTMRTAIGEIEKPKENNLILKVTTDNTGIGAGGGLIASAEYCVSHGII